MNNKQIIALLMVLILSVFFTVGEDIYRNVELALSKIIAFHKPINTMDTRKQSTDPNLKQQRPPPLLSHEPLGTSSNASAVKKYTCTRPSVVDMMTVDSNEPENNQAYTQQFQKYYELNTNLGNDKGAFLSELNLTLSNAFTRLDQTLGLKLSQKVILNMVFKSSRRDYENYVRSQGSSPNGNQGLYKYAKRLSIIQIKSYEQGIDTALHEAMHAFQHAYFGPSLSFFGEGLAEYFGSFDVNGSLPAFDFAKMVNQQHPQDLPLLLNSEQDWHNSRQHDLYQNSEAFLFFMMGHNLGRKTILRIIEAEKVDPCTALPVDVVLKIITDNFPYYEVDFAYWFYDGLQAHLEQNDNKR